MIKNSAFFEKKLKYSYFFAKNIQIIKILVEFLFLHIILKTQKEKGMHK
jgi:hypothetical protein